MYCERQVVKTPTIILNNPVYIYIYIYIHTHTHTHTHKQQSNRIKGVRKIKAFCTRLFFLPSFLLYRILSVGMYSTYTLRTWTELSLSLSNQQTSSVVQNTLLKHRTFTSVLHTCSVLAPANSFSCCFLTTVSVVTTDQTVCSIPKLNQNYLPN